MKILTFNVNGIRARLHQLAAVIEQHNPDIIGLQETKVQDAEFPVAELQRWGYYLYYYGQKGHYGVAFLVKTRPTHVQYGFPDDDACAQRRLMLLHVPTSLGEITVINGYFPQGEDRTHPTKFLAKATFYRQLTHWLRHNADKNKGVLVIGDMNICPADADIGIGEANRQRWLRTGKCAFLPEERVWLSQLLDWGLIDLWRSKHPDDATRFSWFDYRTRAFNDNRGLRIDLLLATQNLADRCTACGIDYTIRAMDRPSDHAPVWAQFSL